MLVFVFRISLWVENFLHLWTKMLIDLTQHFKHMKKIFAILLAALALSSCSIVIRTDDSPAKAFEGTYTLAVHEAGSWGQTRVDDRYQAVVQIRKTGFDTVRLYGAFETTGRVEGNRIYIQSVSSKDSYGTLNTDFVDCTLNGDYLSMQVRQSGNLLSVHTGSYLRLSTSLTLQGSRK